jgi:hypothetical protein
MLPVRTISAKAPILKVHTAKKVKVHRAKETIFDRLGWKGLASVVWRSTPLPIRLLSFPYGVAVYRKFLATCETVEEVRKLHYRKCKSSRIFRYLRPRYRKAKYLLV